MANRTIGDARRTLDKLIAVSTAEEFAQGAGEAATRVGQAVGRHVAQGLVERSGAGHVPEVWDGAGAG